MNLEEQYQKRLEHIRYLNLNEVLKIVKEYVIDDGVEEQKWSYLENPLALSLQFYDRINPVWGTYLKKFSKTSNFRYIEGLPISDCGCFVETKTTPYRLLVSKNHTVEDVFVLVHEFGHIIADKYRLYSSKITQEVFSLLMEFLLMSMFKEVYPEFEDYFNYREKRINCNVANRIIEEINFIKEYRLKKELSESDIQKMRMLLEGEPLDILFSYVVAEYYLEDYKALEKRKELLKR